MKKRTEIEVSEGISQYYFPRALKYKDAFVDFQVLIMDWNLNADHGGYLGVGAHGYTLAQGVPGVAVMPSSGLYRIPYAVFDTTAKVTATAYHDADPNFKSQIEAFHANG